MAGGAGTLILILIAVFLGVDPTPLLQQVATQAPAQRTPPPATGGPADELADFVAVVLGDTEDTWKPIFAANQQRYVEPTLVLFNGQVQSRCGFASAAVGPFYCPADQQIYLDLSFFRELQQRFGAPGDFAQAYVIAHEVGHHVQNLLGIAAQVRQRQQGLSQAQANALSVRQELQADCFSGVWARRADQARNILEQGDLEEALGAASAIGDDRLQKQSRGYVVPDSFTHGSSAQRQRWFLRGMETGDPAACDTFAADTL